jgi:cell division transport system permease protein
MNRRAPKNRLKAAPPPKAAARAARAPRLGLRAWREQHLYSLFSSLGRIAARPLATLLTLLVMALALAMPLLLFVLLDNAQQLRGDMQQAGAISVFLKPNQDAAVAETLAKRVRARAGVASVTVKTPEQGLQEFRSQSGFADAMKVLRENPLPAVLVVTPRADAAGADAPAQLAGSLGAEPEVDLVQYDAAWRQRLDAILGAATRFAEVLAGLLALAALLVVGNTVRLDILGRARREQRVRPASVPLHRLVVRRVQRGAGAGRDRGRRVAVVQAAGRSRRQLRSSLRNPRHGLAACARDAGARRRPRLARRMARGLAPSAAWNAALAGSGALGACAWMPV